MKKGFTLIELLAVISLLAIVALIATPIILNVIDDSKESANLRSIEGYARAIKQEYYNQSMDGSIPVIDETFLSNVEKSGGDVVCENILYSTDNGVIMYKCKFPNTDKEYCYAKETHYACDDSEFLEIYNNNSSKLIENLLNYYQDGNQVGLVKDSLNTNLYYFTGTNEDVSNNYLLYGGQLWRILEFDTNADTLTLITQKPSPAIKLSENVWTTEEIYNSSYVNTWLNDYFLNSLDSSIKSNIKDSTFNIGIYTDVDEITTIKKVGLLDEEQYERAGSQNSYLDIKDYFWLGNRYNASSVRYVHNDGSLYYSSPSNGSGVRPVIKIPNMTIKTGEGTDQSPYILQ